MSDTQTEIFEALDRFGDLLRIEHHGAGSPRETFSVFASQAGETVEVVLSSAQAHELVVSLADALGYCELN